MTCTTCGRHELHCVCLDHEFNCPYRGTDTLECCRRAAKLNREHIVRGSRRHRVALMERVDELQAELQQLAVDLEATDADVGAHFVRVAANNLGRARERQGV